VGARAHLLKDLTGQETVYVCIHSSRYRYIYRERERDVYEAVIVGGVRACLARRGLSCAG